jgi:putative transposase
MDKHLSKRIITNGDIYFITCVTKDRFSFFKEKWLCEFWIEELKFCRQLKNFELHAFCLLPDHFHLLIQPSNQANISEIMRSFKTNFSRNANVLMRYTQARSRDRAYKQRIEIWREKCQINKKRIPKFQWQKSYHDHVIRDDKDLSRHFDYTELNFTKHGLPDNWKYSSCWKNSVT